MMQPNLFIHEYLMFERHRERQRAAEQQRLVARMARHRSGLAHRLVSAVRTSFLRLGTRLKGLESGSEPVIYALSNE
jgi:hypothetical protein